MSPLIVLEQTWRGAVGTHEANARLLRRGWGTENAFGDQIAAQTGDGPNVTLALSSQRSAMEK